MTDVFPTAPTTQVTAPTPMPGTALAAMAARLHHARSVGSRVPIDGPAPSVEDAYRLQAALDALADSPRIGVKLGATLDAALATLGLDRAFHASLFARHHYENGAEVPIFAAHPTAVEAEFVVTVGEDIVGGDTPLDAAAIRAATASVRPGFELVATRFDMPLAGNGTRLVADSGGQSATVISEAVDERHWQALDFTAHPVSLRIDGEHRADGHSGQSIGGSPFAMIAWLLTRPAFARTGLKAGEIIYCGSCTGMLPVASGNRLEADFGSLGRVSATLVDAVAAPV